MKPKLIILNGPPGIGKSTLAEKYANEHPLTLKLDVDKVRELISHWREYDKESGPDAKNMAAAMARIHLHSGRDVIVPQIYRGIAYLEELELVAKESDADLYEFVLFVSKEEAVKRFIDRGKAGGYSDGFRPGGIIARGGGVKKLEQMYDEMMAVTAKRSSTKKIVPILNDIEGTYTELLKYIV